MGGYQALLPVVDRVSVNHPSGASRGMVVSGTFTPYMAGKEPND